MDNEQVPFLLPELFFCSNAHLLFHVAFQVCISNVGTPKVQCIEFGKKRDQSDCS